MQNFREPVKEDVPRLRENFEKYSTMGCDYNFANVYLWHKKYNIKRCLILTYMQRYDKIKS